MNVQLKPMYTIVYIEDIKTFKMPITKEESHNKAKKKKVFGNANCQNVCSIKFSSSVTEL